jgi:hypothetical protein
VYYLLNGPSTESPIVPAEGARVTITAHLITVYLAAIFVGALAGAMLGALVAILDGWLSTAFTGA